MFKEEEAKLKLRLTPEQFNVCIRKGTEIPFTGEYWDSHEEGVYQCVVCGNSLFDSEAKFDSGTGWPSFWEPMKKDGIREESDRGFFFMRRTEVQCARCGSHLGHVFGDWSRAYRPEVLHKLGLSETSRKIAGPTEGRP
jgi:peptide-methionine (R)-S-oxide reductase